MRPISKADQYFLEILLEVQKEGTWDRDPRPKWSDGTSAFSKFITEKTFDYRIDKGEFPIISLRPTAIKGGWHDIEAIYIKQTNLIEEMHPSIQPWWAPFVVSKELYKENSFGKYYSSIGQTYGHTVKRYKLVDKLLEGISKNPFGRRHIINLWQEQQMLEDPKALVPCAYETIWSVVEELGSTGRYIDLTLNQRSQDFLMTASINPMQYVMFGMMVCGHLTFTTGVLHTLRKFKYNVQNLHIYDRHFFALSELYRREPSSEKFEMDLVVHKNFYDYKFEDFLIVNPFKNIEPLSKPLELAI